MTRDEILDRLRHNAKNTAAGDRENPAYLPPVTERDVLAVEKELGLELPPLLRRIYCEIGNGGYHLGPGYGLIGLPGGYDNGDDWDIVRKTKEVAEGLD